MLFLIDADRYQIGLVQQDVACHQHGIGKQARIDVVGVLLGFVFELGHAAQLAELGIAGQHPVNLCVLFYMALDERDGFFRIDAAGQDQRIGLESTFFQLRRVLTDGDGVHIYDGVDAVIFFLQLLPVADGPQIVAESDLSAGLNTREHDLFTFCCLIFHECSVLS